MADPFVGSQTAALETWWQGKLVEGESILDQNNVRALWWSYAINSEAIVEDIADLDQAVKVILTTPLGSDIHRPDFSSGIFSYLDYPQPRVTAYVIRESVQAIERWEPRLSLQNVQVAPYSPGIEDLRIVADWQIVESDVNGITTVEVSN